MARIYFGQRRSGAKALMKHLSSDNVPVLD